MSVLRLVAGAEFATIAAAWDVYADSLNPFLRSRYLKIWLDRFPGPELKLALLCDAPTGAIQLALPVSTTPIRSGLPFRQTQYAAHGISPRLEINSSLCDEGAFQQFLSGLMEACGSHRVVLENIEVGSSLAQWLAAYSSADSDQLAVVDCGRRSPYINTDQPFAGLLAGYSKSTRYWLKRSANKLTRRGVLSIERRDRSSISGADVEAAVRVSASSWKGGQGSDIAASENSRMLFEELLLNSPFDDTYLWILKLDKRPISVQIHAIDRGVAYLLRSDFDEQHRADSPGTALLRAILEDYCNRSSISEFDLCGRDYDYKKKVATGYREHVNYRLYRSGPWSTVARLGYRLKNRRSRSQVADTL